MLMILLPYFDIKGPAGESFQAEIKTDRLTIGLNRLELAGPHLKISIDLPAAQFGDQSTWE